MTTSHHSSAHVAIPSDIARLGTILSIWAHPDDETFVCGGLLSWAANHGQRVVCVTATKGEAGSQDLERWPLEGLGEVRSKELAAALNILGITEHHWLGYRDGHCAEADIDAVAEKLAVIIREVKPNTVLTFGKEGWTGHPDHQAVCRWSHAALKRAASKAAVFHPVVDKQHYHSHLKEADEKLDIFYAIDEPPIEEASHCDIGLSLSQELLDCKREAFAAMPSQTDLMFTTFDKEFLDEAWSTECLMRCAG